MPQAEHADCASVLDDFMNRVANLPAEIAFMQEEIAEKDKQIQDCQTVINKCDNYIQKWIRINGSHVPNPKEEQYRKTILENYDKAQLLQEEKVALSEKTLKIFDKHTRALDGQIQALQERGEFPKDIDIPSLLRANVPERVNARPEPSVVAMPLGPINNSSSVANIRHPNQHLGNQRMAPTPPQALQVAGTAASATPPTPAASLLLNRQARESSLGASNKRQRLTGGVGSLPANSSGLARHASTGPGTPKAGTPSSTRAGSAGPRSSQKSSMTSKKVAPHRQGIVPRKIKPGKSGLSRVKGTGRKKSPSSTNDSELSDAESGSVEDEDEALTPPPVNRDVDGDEDMIDPDDDEGGDDKKYCICQSVSYGDMVACDNESCPYEWFHWTCVGLKSEPVGTWICPVCTKNMKK